MLNILRICLIAKDQYALCSVLRKSFSAVIRIKFQFVVSGGPLGADGAVQKHTATPEGQEICDVKANCPMAGGGPATLPAITPAVQPTLIPPPPPPGNTYSGILQ